MPALEAGDAARLGRARATTTARPGPHGRGWHSHRHARAARPAARGLEADAELRRSRDPCAPPAPPDLLCIDPRDVLAPRPSWAARRASDARRARTVEPGQRGDRKRDGDAA